MPEPAQSPLLRHAAATVHGRYLVQPPAGAATGAIASSAPWLIGFHGQGQSAQAMLEPFAAAAPGPEWLVASVQALHPFPTRQSGEVVANWMTSQDRELMIPDNIGYVNNVCSALAAEFGAPARIVFAGFSQGVGMAYRAALSGGRAASHLITSGGDVPPEYRTPGAATQPWPRLLLATGADDAWYTPARLADDLALVRTQRADAQSLVFAGGHEWSAELCAAARELLRAT